MKDSFSSCPVSGGGHRKSEKGRPFEALGRKTPKKSRYYLQLLLSSPLVKVIQEHFLRRQEDRKLMFEVSVGSRLCEGAVKPQLLGAQAHALARHLRQELPHILSALISYICAG